MQTKVKKTVKAVHTQGVEAAEPKRKNYPTLKRIQFLESSLQEAEFKIEQLEPMALVGQAITKYQIIEQLRERITELEGRPWWKFW